MPRNVEIKARVGDFTHLRMLALSIGDDAGVLIRQKDTFYHAARGRLKLREFDDGRGELIAYERPDHKGPKTSRYIISPTSDPVQLHAALAQALGIRGIVQKERTLVMCGRTRIHLDRVEGLGDFMELEVVLEAHENEADGERTARSLMRKLEIAETNLVTAAYIDQLEALQLPG